MNTEDSTPINDVDLDSFSAEFFGTAEKPEVNDDAKDTSPGEDEPATEEVTETEAEVDDNDTEDDEPVVEKPKKQTANERIREINAKYRESERKAEQAERKAEELARRLEALEKAPKEVKTEDTTEVGEPTPDDKNADGTDKYPLGEFDPGLVADRAKYHVNKAWEEKQAEEAAQTRQKLQQEQMKETAEAWESKLHEAETSALPDIRENAELIVNEFSALNEDYGNYLAQTLMSLEKGPEVLNYLAEHLDEARKIVASGPTKATIALGRLEARFMTEDGNKVKPKVTQAPEPPKNLNRGNNGRFEVPDDTDDFDSFYKKWNSYKK